LYQVADGQLCPTAIQTRDDSKLKLKQARKT
jgi:hypothetical protein